MSWLKKIWETIDGNKTYISATAMLFVVGIKSVFPNSIPDELYREIKTILELLVYGSTTHAIVKKTNKYLKT